MEDNKQVIIPYSEYQEMQAKIAEADMRIKAEVAKQTEEAIKQKDEEFKIVIGRTLSQTRKYMSDEGIYRPLIYHLKYIKEHRDKIYSMLEESEKRESMYQKQAHAAKEKAKRLEEENEMLRNKLKRKWWQIWKNTK